MFGFIIAGIFWLVGLNLYLRGCSSLFGCPNPPVVANVTNNHCDQTLIDGDQIGFNCFVHVRSLDGRYDCRLVNTDDAACTNAVTSMRTVRECDRYQTVKYPLGTTIHIHPWANMCYSSGYAFKSAGDGMILIFCGGMFAIMELWFMISRWELFWKPCCRRRPREALANAAIAVEPSAPPIADAYVKISAQDNALICGNCRAVMAADTWLRTHNTCPFCNVNTP